MKLLSNSVFTIAIILFFISLTVSFIVIQIIIHKKLVIDQNNVNLFDILLRASFVLIGSSLSGFVAFLIFFLGDRKKELEKIENERKILSLIEDEVDSNLKIFEQMLTIFADTPIKDLAELLHKDNSKVKEGLLIYYTKLNFSVLDGSIKDIDETSYLNNIVKWRKQKVIYHYLELLLTKIQHKENSITLLEQIKNEIISITKM